ncbi:ninjurin 2 [Elysia marginata]|uniref:Ninjurin 2 n=1 Tax=Elysia marginata TaxID=1093978 RepID=A0AAV4G8Z3_9GAST|nr:ninjurin 2 [Elysia marginata]
MNFRRCCLIKCPKTFSLFSACVVAADPLLHSDSQQENIELKLVSSPEDSTDAEKVSPLRQEEDAIERRAITPFVLRVEAPESKHRRSRHSKSDEDDSEEEEDLDLAPDALESLTVKNQFTVRKMAAQGLIDVALMMANISQLRTLITAGSDLDNYEVLLSMVCFSLAAQVMFAIIIFVIYMREAEETQREAFLDSIRKGDVESISQAERTKVYRTRMEEKFRRHKLTNRLNFATIVLVFVITVINMFITGFGIKLGKKGQAVSLFDWRNDMKGFSVANASVKAWMPMNNNISSFAGVIQQPLNNTASGLR